MLDSRHDFFALWFCITSLVKSQAVPGFARRSLTKAAKTRPAWFTNETNYFASAAFCMPASSFLMSSGDSFGRSTLIVSLLNLAVSGNGGW